MTGVEIAVGYAFAWLVRKAKRVTGRADTEVDRGLDAAMDRLHVLISAKLGADPALERAREEAGEGRLEPSERTRRRLTDFLEDAAEHDTAFAEALAQLVEHLESLHGAADGASAGGDHVDFRHGTFHGPVQGKGVQHINYGKAPE
ncbi:chromosome partitioning protein [Streptomyces sp. MUSC 125]|uniref:chromosome partitioning protein n=1 Tax=Streptomyces sp. MUSC 125 TaxID=1428624 RepID=UPI00131DFAB4|nr:chromosome partitioning protein [Streptomyces sp. MUSC 125]